MSGTRLRQDGSRTPAFGAVPALAAWLGRQSSRFGSMPGNNTSVKPNLEKSSIREALGRAYFRCGRFAQAAV